MIRKNMKERIYVYQPTKTTKFVQKVLKVACWCGSPNFWFEDLDVTPLARRIHHYYSLFLHPFVWFSFVIQIGAFFTQHELPEKVHSDHYLFIIAYVSFYAFLSSIGHYKEKLRALMLKMMVQMKEIHNDSDIEQHFMDQSLFYLRLYGAMWIGVITFFALDHLATAIFKGTTFITMITAWPDVHDYSVIADIARVLIFIKWVMEMMWFSTVYTLAIPVMVGLSHQYMNLGKYFESLNGIFEREGNQQQKEIDYEKAIKVGIKCHTDVLWCVRTIQDIFSVLNGGQIFLTTMSLIVLMYQYTQMERTMVMMVSLFATASSVLLTTGCLMWKAGDVTYEAAALATAIYSSGWQHCTREASRRVRPLIVISMAVAQIPVELKGLGLVTFSYQSYVSIVKSSYTVFSVLY